MNDIDIDLDQIEFAVRFIRHVYVKTPKWRLNRGRPL